jgi:hypothetical protein
MNYRIPLVVLLGLLAACSQHQPPPVKTNVCEVSAKPGQNVQIDATVSTDAEGQAMLGDSRCPATRIPLQLSTAASRAGADELLQSAAKRAVSSGQSSFAAQLAGVYTESTQGAQFVASSVSIAAPH